VKIILMDVLIMVPGRVKNIMWGWPIRTIKSNRLTYITALHMLRIPVISRAYHRLEGKREFYSRIRQIDPDKYLDTSHTPNLNVIIITVDCMRNSNLSSQGYFRETTPFLDSIRTRFTAISAAPWTYPSVASILTGLYPHNHNAIIAGDIKHFDRIDSFQKLRGDILTLHELLFLLGYDIYFGTGIPAAFWSVKGRVILRLCDDSAVANDLLSDLTKWISKNGKRKFFAYAHLADLHTPFNTPESYRHFFADVKEQPNLDFYNWELLYDNSLRYVDSAIERLFHFLKDTGIMDRTIVVVTGDHGEEFSEHRKLEAEYFYDQRGLYGLGHAHNVFNEIIQVPLLMSGPIPDRKSDHLVSTVDIMPTIIDLLGISHKMRFDGRNIFESAEERPLLSEAVACGYEKKALVIGRYKLIYSKDDGVEWLFDLEKDPGEQHPIVDKEVTSIFMEKLHHILRDDEKRKIREIASKKGL
jgi:arylsulfatase A-like enzyme